MNKREITYLTLLCAFFAFTPYLNAQKNSYSEMHKRAIELAEDGDYNQAIPLLKRVEEKDPDNIDVQYDLGNFYLNTAHGPDSAVIHFSKAQQLLDDDIKNTDFGIDLYMSLAKSLQRTYQFEKAIDIYNDLQSFIPEDFTELRKVIQEEIQTANNGILLMKNPVKLEIENIGDKVNSKYDDHTPVVNAEETTLFFTSKRISSYSQKIPNGQFSEKIYASKFENGEWNEAEIITSILDTDSHESILSISPDGTEMYLLRSNMDGKNILVSNYDGSTWSEPYKLPKGINSRFTETHACISADKSFLLFTSNRPGGYGGLDIYYVRKIPNGEWGVPVNLGPKINTALDEETPMLHPGGKTLYFSSEGHNSMGGFDIFYSNILPDSSFTDPINMGYPINTPDDDIFFVPTASSNKAYLASARFESNIGGTDIYAVEYEEPEIEKMAVLKGYLENDYDLSMEKLKITVTNEGQIVGKYKVNPEDDSYIMILEAEKTYDITYTDANFNSYSSTMEISSDMTYHNRENVIFIDKVRLNPSEEALAALNTKAEDTDKELASADNSNAIKTNPLNGKYTIQFLALKKSVDLKKHFKNLDLSKVEIVKCKDGYYRYIYGAYDSFKEAKNGKTELLKVITYKDSFVRYLYQIDELKE